MNDLVEARMKVCQGHPDQQEIFLLEKFLIESGHPYFFNFWEDLRPVFGGDPDGDPEGIDWNTYKFLIEIGEPAGVGLSRMSVCFSTGNDPKLLELLDVRPAAGRENPTAADGRLYKDLTAAQAMEIIEKFFNGLWP